MPVDPWILALAMAITVVAAIIQGTVGFGLGVISVPLLSLLDRDLAPVPQLLIVLVMAMLMVWRERTDLDLSGVGWVMAGRLPGAVLGLALIKAFADSKGLDGLIAVLVIMAVLTLASGVTIPITRTTQVVAGIVSATTSLVASIGGPPIALLYRTATGAKLRSTLNAIFVLGITLTILVRALASEISGDDLQVAGFLLPSALLGLWISRSLTGKIEGQRLRTAVLLVSGLAAVGLLGRALFS
ncbi:MAG: sulfite exporter TauE/SafE family protein [Acidimicrobiia bacterium]|nr:sulfite exporter TauE/SafE family protein [Acidimicrobiia bacterium]